MAPAFGPHLRRLQRFVAATQGCAPTSCALRMLHPGLSWGCPFGTNELRLDRHPCRRHIPKRAQGGAKGASATIRETLGRALAREKAPQGRPEISGVLFGPRLRRLERCVSATQGFAPASCAARAAPWAIIGLSLRDERVAVGSSSVPKAHPEDSPGWREGERQRPFAKPWVRAFAREKAPQGRPEITGVAIRATPSAFGNVLLRATQGFAPASCALAGAAPRAIFGLSLRDERVAVGSSSVPKAHPEESPGWREGSVSDHSRNPGVGRRANKPRRGGPKSAGVRIRATPSAFATLFFATQGFAPASCALRCCTQGYLGLSLRDERFAVGSSSVPKAHPEDSPGWRGSVSDHSRNPGSGRWCARKPRRGGPKSPASDSGHAFGVMDRILLPAWVSATTGGPATVNPKTAGK